MKDFKAIIIIIILVLVGTGAFGFRAVKNYEQKREKTLDEKLALLQKQISAVQNSFEEFSGRQVPEALPIAEVAQREIIRQKSQDELLTEAVAKNAPAVVSIVISKYVPELEVVYENPFGNDPFYRDFGIRVPRYRQKGLKKKKVGAGTGFLITDDGYILTNRHVVSDTEAEYMVLLSNGEQKIATVKYKDPRLDVAVLKIEGSGFAKVRLGDSNSLQLGQTVIAIGNALGEYNNSVSTGIISGLNRTIEALNNKGKIEALSGVIQTDAAINPGNSGGPLITLDGEIVGINVATVTGTNNISFSIPINTVRQIVKTVVGI